MSHDTRSIAKLNCLPNHVIEKLQGLSPKTVKNYFDYLYIRFFNPEISKKEIAKNFKNKKVTMQLPSSMLLGNQKDKHHSFNSRKQVTFE